MLSIIVSHGWYLIIIGMAVIGILIGMYFFIYDDIANTPDDEDDIDLFPPSDENK
jgi:hypothetical protein